jgi:glycosyltransferase involved in cell wall biosynthesis
MIRILQLTTLPLTMQVFVRPLAHALADCGYEVELACAGIAPREFEPFPAYSIALSRSPFAPANGCGLARLIQLMRTRRYDVVHVHTPVAALVGRLAARLARVPLVLYTLHGSFWGTRPLWRAALFDGLERLAAPWTSHVFALNDADVADLQHCCGFAPAQLTRLPVGGAGVDLAAFDVDRYPPEAVARLRQDFGLAETEMVVGYVGRIDRDKGIGELLSAFARLRQGRPNLKLLMVGTQIPGDRNALADTLLAELGPAVICTGFRPDVPALLAIMDLVVSPSRRDGFGMVLAEAAAMGKVVVATTTRGAQAAVADGVTGLLTPIGDVGALARAVHHLLDQPALRRIMGQAARRLAVARFDRARTMELYQATYARLLQQI